MLPLSLLWRLMLWVLYGCSWLRCSTGHILPVAVGMPVAVAKANPTSVRLPRGGVGVGQWDQGQEHLHFTREARSASDSSSSSSGSRDSSITTPQRLRLRALLTVYGRHSSQTFRAAQATAGREVQLLSLPELFDWALANGRSRSKNSNCNKGSRQSVISVSVVDPVAACVVQLFEIAALLSPDRFERFMAVHEQLQRLVRRELAVAGLCVGVDWRRGGLLDLFPPEFAVVHNVSAAAAALRFDLTQPLGGRPGAGSEAIVTYSGSDLLKRTRGGPTEDSADVGACVRSDCVFLPSDIRNPGFDSCYFLRPEGNPTDKNFSPVAVLSEQKVSTRRSRMFIHLYRDVVRKSRLALRQLKRCARQAAIAGYSTRTMEWDERNVVFVGQYLRKLHPKLDNGARRSEKEEMDSKVSSRSAGLLTSYFRQFEFPQNTIVYDETGIRMLMGETMFELLNIARDRKQNSKTSSKVPQPNKQLFTYVRRLLESKYSSLPVELA